MRASVLLRADNKACVNPGTTPFTNSSFQKCAQWHVGNLKFILPLEEKIYIKSSILFDHSIF